MGRSCSPTTSCRSVFLGRLDEIRSRPNLSTPAPINNIARDNGGFGLILLPPKSGSDTSGYATNVFVNNNGGNANPQVDGGTEIGRNICGTNTTCP